jgi:site-specific recombinase XerD
VKEVVPVLEKYYVKPKTVDRVRASWIGTEIELYVTWLADHDYAARSVLRRIPLLVTFGEFAHARGARTVEDLAAHVEPFVAERVAAHSGTRRCSAPARQVAKEIRGPIEQMLRLVVPEFAGRGRPHSSEPFADAVPGFFEHLASERGLRPATIWQYRHHLCRFEAYLARIGVAGLEELSPAILSAFVAERAGAGLAKSSIRNGCGVLRVFLRYVHRSGLVPSDLSGVIESPQAYRLSSVPRSISWEQVAQVLAGVDRRSPVGKRDYAILLLLVTYGLRAREIAALTLDDIDWKRERLAVPERKAGHSTAFPLSHSVGEALVDYLRHGRPQSADRQVFLRAVAPIRPIGSAAVSSLARSHLLKAGIEVPRPGSHTLRHTCVQRLVDADFALKTIGDFVGHRSPSSTEIYAKVAVESLRDVALGDGEEVLS